MMYNYPFFSFPHFRRYANYYPMQYSYAKNQFPTEKNLPNIPNSSINSKFHKPVNTSVTPYQRKNSYNEDINHKSKVNSTSNFEGKKERSFSKKVPSGFSFLNNFLHQEDRNEDETFFDLLGLKLYNDDLLLIGLIFFLYKEDVKDQYLFFALILLLLS